jgi:hypothetical protein
VWVKNPSTDSWTYTRVVNISRFGIRVEWNGMHKTFAREHVSVKQPEPEPRKSS